MHYLSATGLDFDLATRLRKAGRPSGLRARVPDCKAGRSDKTLHSRLEVSGIHAQTPQGRKACGDWLRSVPLHTTASKLVTRTEGRVGRHKWPLRNNAPLWLLNKAHFDSASRGACRAGR